MMVGDLVIISLRGIPKKYIGTIIALPHTSQHYSLRNCYKVAYGDGRVRWVVSEAVEPLE